MKRSLLVLVLLAAGCRDDGKSVAPYAVTAGTIFPSGGRVAASGGPIDRASIFVPLGAVAAPLTIAVTPVGSTIAPGCFTPAGPAVAILPAVALASSATVAVPFTTAGIAGGKSADDLVVVHQDPATGAFTVLEATGKGPSDFSGANRLVFTEAAALGFFQAAVATAGAPTITGTTSPGGGAPPVVSTAGGTVVEVRGANLFAGAEVLFGDEPGTDVVEVQAGTILRVTAPPHPAGVVHVTVTNVDGQGVTFPGAFEYADP